MRDHSVEAVAREVQTAGGMLHSRRSATALALAIALAGCSGDSETSDPPGENRLPTWAEAPASLTIGEGQQLAVPVTAADEDGDAVSVVAIASEGLAAEMTEEGLVLYADYGVTGGNVDVQLDDAGGAIVTVSIPVTVSPLRWADYQSWTTAEGPEEREHPAVLVDAASRSAFLMHGSGYHPQFEQMLDDVWRYGIDDGSWSLVTPTGDVPPASGSRRLAGAHGSGSGYLFGGYGPAGAFDGELHRVEVAGGTLAFTAVQQNGAPSARALHTFAYDPVTERYVLFGGVGSSVLGDTWLMEIDDAGVAQWTELALSPTPGPRYGSFSAFDEDHGRLLMFSGAQEGAAGNPVNPSPETWALDMRADPPVWSLVSTTFSPPGRRNGSVVWDEGSSRMFVFGGTPDAATTAEGLFVLDARPGLERWLELPLVDPPSFRSSGTGFHDGERAYFGFGNDNAIYRDWAVLGY